MTFASSRACYLHAYALFSLDYEGRYNVHGLQMYMLQARSAPKQAPMCVPSFKPRAMILWVERFRRLIDGNSNVREEIVALKMCYKCSFYTQFLPSLLLFAFFHVCFREVFLTFVSAGIEYVIRDYGYISFIRHANIRSFHYHVCYVYAISSNEWAISPVSYWHRHGKIRLCNSCITKVMVLSCTDFHSLRTLIGFEWTGQNSSSRYKGQEEENQ